LDIRPRINWLKVTQIKNRSIEKGFK